MYKNGDREFVSYTAIDIISRSYLTNTVTCYTNICSMVSCNITVTSLQIFCGTNPIDLTIESILVVYALHL